MMEKEAETIIDQIVESLCVEDLYGKKAFYLRNSLLALARAANLAGYTRGCMETLGKITEQLEAASTVLYESDINALLKKRK